ncbi:MAG TPA: O-antigen ligase family protein [Syntrophorhabdales bacterium]|nr:O-antigen ligase family protein [Syntrophorhabdales bacterium]
MTKGMLILVVLCTSLLGGYLSPQWGITFFFLLIVLLFLTVKPDIRLGKDEVLSLLFSCCGVASVLYAADKWGAILFSGSLVAGSFFYVALRNSSGWDTPLLKTIVLGGCIVGLCEALHQMDLLPHGLFYNPNPFSGFLTPLVPVSLYLYSKFRKDIYVAASMLLVFANFISASRSGVATMILAFAAMGVFFYRGKDRTSVKALLLIFLVGFSSFLLFSEAKDVLIVKNAVGMLEKQPTAITQRAYLLGTTFQVIRQAPLLGHGLNSFFAVMSTMSNPYVVYSSIHAHSLYLNILAELGIVGLLLFFSFIVTVLKGPVSSFFLLKIALLSFLFHNVVEYNFPPPTFQVLFYLLCAAIVQGKGTESSLFRISGKPAKALSRLLALYFLLVHLFPICGFILLDRANAALQKGDMTKTVRYLFASTYFGYSVSAFPADAAQLLTDVYFASNMKDSKLLEIAEKNYMKALALNSLDGAEYVKVASFYASTGRPDKAQAYLSKVIEKYPYHQEYRLALARLYAGQGRSNEATEILEASEAFLKKYAPLDPLRVEVLIDLARMYHNQGDAGRAEGLMAKALRLKALLESFTAPKEEKRDLSLLPAR